MLVSNARALPRPCAAAAFVRILDAFAFEDPQGKASDSGSAVEPEVDAASGARSHRNDPSVRRSCLAASRSARAVRAPSTSSRLPADMN
jgi:hypothetical protein